MHVFSLPPIDDTFKLRKSLTSDPLVQPSWSYRNQIHSKDCIPYHYLFTLCHLDAQNYQIYCHFASPSLPTGVAESMSSLVSDFIINPVLRQARRFSEISRSTFAADDHETPVTAEPGAVSDPDVLAAVEHQEPPVTMDHGDAEPVARPQTPRSRPVSASTQETRVEVALEASPSNSTTNHDHLGFPLSARRGQGQGIPEDDGMHELRRRIQAVNSQDISPEEKARRMHELLLEGYRTSQAGVQSRGQTPLKEVESLGPADEPSTSPGPLESLKSWYTQQAADQTATAEKFVLSDSDVAPTFAPLRQRKGSDDDLQALSPTSPTELQAALGCQHYERNVKLQCFTCKKWYTCRFCHDAEEDHNLVRTETRNMLCMLCATPQKASDVCINCGEVSAYYYCNICKLWENRKSRPIYHCNDCGICRRGEGLGKDFFHCKVMEMNGRFRGTLPRGWADQLCRLAGPASPHPSGALTNASSGPRTVTAPSVASTCLRRRGRWYSCCAGIAYIRSAMNSTCGYPTNVLSATKAWPTWRRSFATSMLRFSASRCPQSFGTPG